MKSCLGMLLSMIILLGVIGSGLMIWYLSASSEITAKPATAAPGR